MGQRVLAGSEKPIDGFPVELIGTLVEMVTDLVGEFTFSIHSSMPFAFNAAANECVAREQCVFTLPSEHPIAAAVSAISMSSQ
jgi:hypothetical protein